jgi:hypothetical protein
MKTKLNPLEIVSKIEKKLSNLRFKYLTSGTSIITITIKNSDRVDALEEVKKFLNENKSDFNYEFLTYGKSGYRVGVSTFGYISINGKNFNSDKIKEIRVIFKYNDGADKKISLEWNAMLISVFKDHPKLKRSTPYREEMKVLNKINKKIGEVNKEKPITIQIGNKKYNNVAGLVGGKGTSKADFVIVSMDGKEIGFISHKKGDNARSFQQYSGISQEAGLQIHNHSEVKKFRRKLNEILNNAEEKSTDDFSTILNSFPKKTEDNRNYISVYQPIEDTDLKKKAIFGKKSGTAVRGMDNVDFFAQGNPEFEDKMPIASGEYKGQPVLLIKFSTKTVPNNKLTGLDNEEYSPVIGARKDLARVLSDVEDENVKGISGARGGIWTNAYMKNRKSMNIDMSDF